MFSLANHMNGRVGFVATMPSTSASIFINNTQLSDTGTYQCLVNNLPDRGGRNIGVIGLTVLGKLFTGRSVGPEVECMARFFCDFPLCFVTLLCKIFGCISNYKFIYVSSKSCKLSEKM